MLKAAGPPALTETEVSCIEADFELIWQKLLVSVENSYFAQQRSGEVYTTA